MDRTAEVSAPPPRREHAHEEPRLRVFISYARADASDFAEYLAAALELNGFDARLDRHDIAKAEDFEQRIGDLIRKCDTVAFIITPRSIASPRCTWEVERTLELGKRLVPVQWIAVPESDVPPELARLNYTVFTSGQSFQGPLVELIEALRQDLRWLRQQTDLEEQANHWDTRARDPDLLLRGAALADAKHWLAKRKSDAPPVAPLVNAFINASDAAEVASNSEKEAALREREKMVGDRARAQRRVSKVLAALVVAVSFGGFEAYQAYAAADKVKKAAEDKQIAAASAQSAAARAEAAANRAQSEAELRSKLINRIRVAGQKQDGKHALDKICSEAIVTTQRVAQATTKEELQAARTRFWELYYGEMNLIEVQQILDTKDEEGSPVEAAMVMFGDELNASGSSQSSLCELSNRVRDECVKARGLVNQPRCL